MKRDVASIKCSLGEVHQGPVQKNYLSRNLKFSDFFLPIPSSKIEEVIEQLKNLLSVVLYSILIALRGFKNMINLESRFLAVSKDY